MNDIRDQKWKDVAWAYHIADEVEKISGKDSCSKERYKNQEAIFAEDDSKEKMTENQDDEFKQDYKLKTGHFYYTDVRKAHAVENLSDTDRIHLVMDCYVNNEMRYMIC